MVNPVQKGWRGEKLCREQLEVDGWLVAFKSVRLQYFAVDFANLFDVVCIKIIDDKPLWRLISVKNHREMKNYTEHQIDLQNFKNKYSLSDMSIELWRYSTAEKKFIITTYEKQGDAQS